MASDLNAVALVGRLVKPVDMRFTNGGMAIASFTIAVNNNKKVNGQWGDVASFFDCTMFGKRAESLAQFLVKGQQVSISGSLEQQSWDDKATGQKRSKVGILVDDLGLIGSKPQTQQQFGR